MVADLWTERRAEHADDPTYSLSVSTPTNADALMLAGAIRDRRRKAGELTGPDHMVQATDNVGRRFEVALAVGDRVRLFARTPARSYSGQTLEIGVNGSVLEIETIAPEGIRLRDAAGRSGMVAWTTLLHPDGDPAEPRYRLGYGDVLTIDSIQGVTSEESIFVMPNGSASVDAFRGYTAASRHRARSYLICGETAERVAITGRRPIGVRRPVTEDEIWDRVASNLSREPAIVTATALVSRARAVASDARRTLPLALAPLEACTRRGLTQASLRRSFSRSREVAVLTDWAETIAEPLARQVADTAALADTLSGRGREAAFRKATDGREPGGFVGGRILRRLELWAEEIGELIERQLADIMDLTRRISDPDRNVMVNPGRIARQLSRRRDIERLDEWSYSFTEWLDLQVRTTRAILGAISKEPLSERAGPAVEQIPQSIEMTVEPGEAGPRRKQAGRRRGAKVSTGLEI